MYSFNNLIGLALIQPNIFGKGHVFVADEDNDGLIDEDCSDPPTNFQYLFAFMDNFVEYPLYHPLKV